MITQITLLFAFTIIAGIANGAIKTIQHFWEGSIFEARWPKYFFTPVSWLNKYKDRKPENGLRFVGRPFLVWTTCGYRLMVMIRIAALFIVIGVALTFKITIIGSIIFLVLLPTAYYYATEITSSQTSHKY